MLKFIVTTYLLSVMFLSNNIFTQNVNDSINSLPEKEKAEALLKMAKSYYTSNFDLADEYSTRALHIAERLGQKNEMGIANKYLGITDYFRRDFEPALIHYKKALQIFENIPELKEQANVLNNIAVIYIEDGDYTTSLNYHEKALSVRKELNDVKGIVMSFNNIGNIYREQNMYVKALDYYGKAEELNKLAFHEKPNPSLLVNIATCYAGMGNPSKALDYYLIAIDAAEKSKDVRSLINLKNNLGNFYVDIGETEKAIKIMSSALMLATENNMDYNITVLRLNIGNIYYQSNQYHKAAEFYNSALPSYEKVNDYAGQIRCLVNIALTDEKRDMQDSALRKLLLARRIAEQIERPMFLAITANYLGEHYLNTKNFKKSIFWLENALIVSDSNNLLTEQYNSNYHLGLYWLALEKYNESIKYGEKAHAIAKKLDNAIQLKKASEILWICYEKIHEYQKALIAFKEYDILKDSIFDEEKQKQIRIIEGKLNLQMKEGRIASQEQIINQQKIILNQEKKNKVYIIVVAVLLIGLLIIIYNREQLRRNKQRAKLLYEKKLLKTEMEKKELHRKELETELEYKSRQMTTHTLNMMQKNKVLKEMTNDISDISKKVDNNIKQELKRLKFQLNQSLKADKDWDEFRLYFEQVNQMFFSRLREISPNISPSEERLAALIKLKMNIKETASVLNISPSSVKMARHRLRQKLHLPQNVDLYEFIGGIG